jgi:predicted ATPase
MDISIQNLGAIKQADISLGDFTIICGKNNTGKTYVTYAIYGFLDYWHHGLSIYIPPNIISEVIEKGSISVPLDSFC